MLVQFDYFFRHLILSYDRFLSFSLSISISYYCFNHFLRSYFVFFFEKNIFTEVPLHVSFVSNDHRMKNANLINLEFFIAMYNIQCTPFVVFRFFSFFSLQVFLIYLRA